MTKYLFYIFIVLQFCLLSNIQAQNEEKKEVTIYDASDEFIYVYQNDSFHVLSFMLGVSVDREIIPIPGQVINFSAGADKSVSLGSGITNVKGKAFCKIPLNFSIPRDEEGFATFSAEFAGCDTINPVSEELRAKDLTIEMTFSEDSLKRINLFVYQLDKLNKKIPLTNEVINIYTPRTFSMLKIAECNLDSTGHATAIFPNDLPGDSLGNIKILARLEEHSDFLNVEKLAIKKWGIELSKEYLLEKRALWTHVAPIWMIATLSILLIGVWGHYIFVIIKLVFINKIGKKKA